MTNTQYLRARFYQTKTGRFLTQDTYLGDITNPITTNRYIYCIDNPLNYKDPSGYVTVRELYESTELNKYNAREQQLLEQRFFREVIRQASYKNNVSTSSCSGFVGYLKYVSYEDARNNSRRIDVLSDWITTNPNDGFFRLYDRPTLHSKARVYYSIELYAEAGMTPNGALQSWTESDGMMPNKYGFTTYGGVIQTQNNKTISYYDFEKGTITYNGIDRYGIAIGPLLQNPNADLKVYRENKEIPPKEMNYGACVDIGIEINNRTYYIPAIIVDLKENTWDNGIIQTGESITGLNEFSEGSGSIIEWYTKRKHENDERHNKNFGLAYFDDKVEIRIYDHEVLW